MQGCKILFFIGTENYLTNPTLRIKDSAENDVGVNDNSHFMSLSRLALYHFLLISDESWSTTA